MGISTRPVFFTAPARAKTLVPLLFAVPMDAYHDAPFRMIEGIAAYVSTLLRRLGLFQRPLNAGKGGRGRGSPRFPSIEVISAVSSPQTNAPDPILISRSKEWVEPMMFFPSRPRSRACSIARVSRSTASGYSARTYT